MARAKVVNSGDAVTVIFSEDKKNPEPTTGIIKFPGGFVEVARCTDGTYWAHVSVENGVVMRGRINRRNRVQSVESMEDADNINHIAIRIQK